MESSHAKEKCAPPQPCPIGNGGNLTKGGVIVGNQESSLPPTANQTTGSPTSQLRRGREKESEAKGNDSPREKDKTDREHTKKKEKEERRLLANKFTRLKKERDQFAEETAALQVLYRPLKKSERAEKT